MARKAPDAEFWELIHPYTGVVADTQPTARGFGSDLTAVVECEKGPWFVKAMRNRPGGRRDSIQREGLINTAVQPISPPLRWLVESAGWIVLGFEVVAGRRSSFKPDSPDLPAVVEVVDQMGQLPVPEVARNWHESRWDRFTPEGDEKLFQGETLLYTDINESNLMIGEDQTWAVDWSWPTVGAGFIDPACLVVQFIAAGHTAEDAEGWAAGCKTWADADRTALDAFAMANARMYRTFADRRPDATWLEAMATAASDWVVHRGLRGLAAE